MPVILLMSLLLNIGNVYLKAVAMGYNIGLTQTGEALEAKCLEDYDIYATCKTLVSRRTYASQKCDGPGFRKNKRPSSK